MRRSVFLALWLCLVLSLLKGTSTTTSANTSEQTPSKVREGGTGNTTNPDNSTGTPDPNPPEGGTGNTTNPDNSTGTPDPNPPEGGTGNTTNPDNSTGTPDPNPPEGGTGNTTNPDNSTGTPDPNPPGNGTGNTTNPGGNSTVTPEPNPPGNGTGNTTNPGGNSTVTPDPNPPGNGTGNTTNPGGNSTVSPDPADFCHDQPCGKYSAKCISLKSGYTCECEYGLFYKDKNCHEAKVFPATLKVRTPYSDSLPVVNSTEYEEMHEKISKFFEDAFTQLPDYRQTVIVKIEPAKKTRNAAEVNVTVTNLFMSNTNVNEDKVKSAVEAKITSVGEDKSLFHSYNEAEPCAAFECDTQTAECKNTDKGPECQCKAGLEKTEWDARSCSACSKSCSAEAHKYCVREETGPTCKCMNNFREEDENCVACPVGYSGEDCNDNTELILIIVGTVSGAIILSLVIAISVISVRANQKGPSEKRSLIKAEYSDINRYDDRPSMFPRVQSTSGHANPGYQSNNPYEMRSTNRDRFPERDYDDLYEISREPRGFRMQSRY